MLSTARSRLAAASIALTATIGCVIAFAGSAGAAGSPVFEPWATSCPSSSLCVVLGNSYDQDGTAASSDPLGEFSFNPASPSDSAPVEIARGFPISALDCPSTSVCVGVGTTATASAIVFDPASPTKTRQIALPLDKGRALALSCPSRSQCTTWLYNFDDPHPDKEVSMVVTFNPATGAVDTPIDALKTGYAKFTAHGLACPSVTQCTAVGDGAALTFDPNTGAGLADPKRPASRQDGTTGSTESFTTYPSYGAIECPTTLQCTATGKYGSSSNQPLTAIAVTFDPKSGAPIGSQPATLGTDDQSGSRHISCPTTSECTTELGGGRATFATFQTGSGSISEPKTIDRKLVEGLFCTTASSCTAVLSGYDSGPNHSSTPAEIDHFSPATGTVSRTADVAPALSSSSSAGSKAKLKAALAKCKKVKNHKKRVACVKRAKKRYG